MSTAMSGLRVKVGLTRGDVRLMNGGKLLLIGMIAGTLTVESGGYVYIVGMVERLVVEPGGRAKLRGWCKGDVTNKGGDLAVMRSAVIEGALHGRSSTRVDPRAKIGD